MADFLLSNALLRPWRSGDEESLARHANNRNVWRNLRDTFPHPYTLGDAQKYVERQVAEGGRLGYAIEVRGEAAGGIALHAQQDVARCSAEIGYWLGEPHWGQGIMTEAVQTITAFGMNELQLVRIYGYVFEWNPASMRVLEKAGYLLEGRHRKSVTKDGETIDEFLYARVQE